MIRRVFIYLVLFLPFFIYAQQVINIVPQPVSLQMRDGNFIIDMHSAIGFSSKNNELKQAAEFFAAAVKNISGYNLALNANKTQSIRLELVDNSTLGNEGYQLDVTPSSTTIKANRKAGIIYGMQTLLQLMPAIRTNAALEIPCMTITDYPRFKWRGMHLDVSRHFFGPEVIKEYIDLMASYKMNVFHWHLVDDTGWRIEIKKYPKLTQTGAWRVDHTNLPWGTRPQAKEGEVPTYGGYYTQEQIKEIVKYAAARNITIVPEIEMPGHVASAIASYPYLCCTQHPQLPMTGGNYTNMSSNYCAGNDSVFTFIENVLSEVIQLFPSQYIHIGGDEVDKGPWQKCSRCQARMKTEGLKNENELQSYFIKRIEKFLISKHRKMIGWDEILEGGLAPEATVMSWRGESGGIEAARMRHDVIMTPGSPCYLDNYQAGPEGEPLAIGGFNTLKKVYDYEPVPKELSAGESQHVMGAQGNVWTEFIPTTSHLEYMVLPRMLALSEVLWTSKENRNWEDFNRRLQSRFKVFDQKGINYCQGNYTVTIKPVSQNGKLFVALSSEIMDADIYYTLDGSEPTLSSSKYSQPIEITSDMQLKAAVVLNGRVMGVQAARQNFVFHKATGRPVTYAYPYSSYYPADGPNSLTDGVRGTDAVGKFWHGFTENDLVATVDLGEVKEVQSIALGCIQHYKDWIFLPKYVKFEVSTDGITFSEVATVNNPIDINQDNAHYDFKTTFPQRGVKYVRVTAKNNLCPQGHSGAGKPGWLFADEIIVE